MIANQRTTSYDERFKFTGKERDGESGYDYFGARYYTPPLGIWISVDPLADKYPHATPYLYCGGNPVMFFDPDGKEKHCLHTDAENACANLKDGEGIYYCGHGNVTPQGTKANGRKLLVNKMSEIRSLDNQSLPQNSDGCVFLDANHMKNEIIKSPQWQKDKENQSGSIIFLYACHTGELGGIAQQMSKMQEFKDDVFVGAVGELRSGHNPKSPKEDDKYTSSKGWSIYRNGNRIATIPGWLLPNERIIKLILRFYNKSNED